MTDEQIKHMVERFLAWKLPDEFNPDGGISYTRGLRPLGTNLFNYREATEMVEFMVEGLPT